MMRRIILPLVCSVVLGTSSLWAQQAARDKTFCPPHPATPTTVACLTQRIEELKAARLATLQQQMRGLSQQQQQEVLQRYAERMQRAEGALKHFLEQYCPQDKEGICD